MAGLWAFGHFLPFLHLSNHLSQLGHRTSFISTPRNLRRLSEIISPDLSARIAMVPLPFPSVNGLPPDSAESMSRPKTHSKGVTVISHFKPEGLQCNLTQILILLSEVTHYQVPVQSSGTNLKSSIFNLKTKTSTIQNPLSKYLQT